MKTFLNKLFTICVVVFSLFLLTNISNAAINLDMKVNSYGLLDSTENRATYGIGYGIGTAGGLNTKNDLQKSLRNILNIALGFAGTISLGFVIYGGINTMLAKGNKDKYTVDVKLMLTGGVAFLIILFAYVISIFILNFIGNMAGV